MVFKPITNRVQTNRACCSNIANQWHMSHSRWTPPLHSCHLCLWPQIGCGFVACSNFSLVLRWSLIRGIRSNCKAFNDSLSFLQKHGRYHVMTMITKICRSFIAKLKTKTKQYEFLTQPKLIVVCGRFLFAFRRTIVAWSPNIFPSLKQTQQHIKTQR